MWGINTIIEDEKIGLYLSYIGRDLRLTCTGNVYQVALNSNKKLDINLIIGIIITMVLSAFFSGMEIAFVASNRLLAEMDKEKNGIAQKCLTIYYNNPNGFVSTMLVGNNIVLVMYGIFFAQIFDTTLFASFDSATRVILDTLASTLVILFTGEFLPKTLFKSNPNRLLTFFAPLAYVFFIILWPISRFATFLARVLLRLVGV